MRTDIPFRSSNRPTKGRKRTWSILVIVVRRKYAQRHGGERSSGCNANFLIEIIFRGHVGRPFARPPPPTSTDHPEKRISRTTKIAERQKRPRGKGTERGCQPWALDINTCTTPVHFVEQWRVRSALCRGYPPTHTDDTLSLLQGEMLTKGDVLMATIIIWRGAVGYS